MPSANIHHFDATNNTERDEEGDLRLGYYFELTDDDDGPLTDLIGPYGSEGECENAAQREWQTL